MKFVTDLDKGILGNPDNAEMWSDIIDQIPEEILLNKDAKILNVACGHSTEAREVIKRMRSLGVSAQEANEKIYVLDKYSTFTNAAKMQGYQNVIQADFTEWETDMRFDVILGNPPYQDGSKKGGQNKIYNQFCKKSLELLKNDGVMAFVTPTSVLKKSKRFSLINQPGLKYVDFTANNYFDVGAKICSWVVDRSYDGNIRVNHTDGCDEIPAGQAIYDFSEVDRDFADLYQSIRSVTKDMNFRMFKHNSIDMSKCRSQIQDDNFKYPVYKLNSDGSKIICQYNSVKPKLFGEKTFTVAISKKFDESMTTVDDLDYDMTHVSVAVENDEQVSNIKSFLFSDYFCEHVEKWKQADGYGWNYAVLYLPPFDKTHPWTNDQVRDFLESFRHNQA